MKNFYYQIGAYVVLGVTVLTTIVSNSSQVEARSFPRCDTNQLSLRFVENNPGAGNTYNKYALTNVSGRTCTLYGYPGVELLSKYNKPVGVTVERDASKPKTTVTLRPSAKAYFVLRYGNKANYDGQCAPDSAKIEVTPPNTYNHLIISHPESACRRATVSPVSS